MRSCRGRLIRFGTPAEIVQSQNETPRATNQPTWQIGPVPKETAGGAPHSLSAATPRIYARFEIATPAPRSQRK